MIETKTKSLPSGDAPRSLRSGRQTQVLRLAQDDKAGSFPSGDAQDDRARSFSFGDAAQLLRSGRPEA